ncbi:MAG: ATP-binding protein, partial [Limisphaerales bacterium]
LLERIDKQIAAHDSVRAIDCELRSASGKARYVLLSVEAIDIDDEECLLFIFQDVTERLALMDQLRESQKMEAVGQLAAGVAHDFNNLLTIIRGNCDILRDVGKDDEELTEISGELSDATNRATDLTRQLLAFSRKQVMQPRISDLNTILSSSLKMVKRLLGEGVTVHSSFAGEELPVFADPGMLDQVLVNFVVNARDAMAGKGTLTIRSGIVEISQEDLKKHVVGRDGAHVYFSVEDTGDGIDPETLKRIFEPFFTTKEVGKGTGLGLATVYGIARQHRGWIDVDSKVGQGSTFSVYLPMAEHEDAVIVANEQNLGGNENVLVVEDETAVRRLVCRTLERVGYTVFEAENAEAAEQLWNLHKLDIDLLVSDLVMPGGKSGFELAQELTAARPDLPVIYMSGYSAEFVEKGRDLDMGVNFVPKPFTRKAILEIVRNRLDAASS